MIKAVLLDLDDTLVHTSIDHFFPAYLRELGLHAAEFAPPEQFIEQLMVSFEQTLDEYAPTRPLDERLMENFASDGGFERAALKPLFDSFYEERYTSLQGWIKPRPASARLLDWLFDRDYKVVVATNPGLPEAAIHHRMRWGGIPPEAYNFDLITTLQTMHFGKPHAEYYAEIILRLGVDPDEAIMVGDDWEADLVGATAAGLHTYWVTPDEPASPPDGVKLNGFGSFEAFVGKVEEGWLETLGCHEPSQAAVRHRLAAYPAAIDAVRRPHSRDVLECNPGDDEWSARDIVCHLRDHEAQVREQLQRVLREDNPFLSANTSPWEYGQSYRKVSFEAALAVFTQRRADMVAWLDSLPPEAWQQRARDAIFGPTCFAELVGFLAEHDRTHYQQMHSALDYALTVCG